MENGRNVSEGSSRKRRESVAKRRKQRKIRRIVLTALAALIPLALIAFIMILIRSADEKDPSKESQSQSSEVRTTEAISSEEPSSPEPSSGEPSSSGQEPAASSSEAPVTTESTPPETPSESSPSAPSYPDGTVWYGDYPGAPPMEVQGNVKMPSWIKQELLTVSDINRPGTKLEHVNAVIIHYVGNTGSTAKDNRDYFQSQQDPREPSYRKMTSAHFVVDLDGTPLQCVPIDEVAYASYPRNFDTVAIETCHINDAGEYTPETYQSMVKLSAWLLEIYGLTENDLLRHDDVRPSPKGCPRWFMDHPDAWEQFKKDVRSYMDAHPDIEHEFP